MLLMVFLYSLVMWAHMENLWEEGKSPQSPKLCGKVHLELYLHHTRHVIRVQGGNAEVLSSEGKCISTQQSKVRATKASPRVRRLSESGLCSHTAELWVLAPPLQKSGQMMSSQPQVLRM